MEGTSSGISFIPSCSLVSSTIINRDIEQFNFFPNKPLNSQEKLYPKNTSDQSDGCAKEDAAFALQIGLPNCASGFLYSSADVGHIKDINSVELVSQYWIPTPEQILWEERMQRGLFRYDVTACETKVIHGDYGFIAQLNEGRHLNKRPEEFRVDKVLQPFDENKFNFTKVGQEEVVFQFEASEDDGVQFFPNAPIDIDSSPSVVAINVIPIEYGHVLLILRILECLPQRIDRESFLLALYMAVEAGNPYFRVGYNSLGANAVSDACICLQENNIPHNVLIADSGKQIFLFPQ